jgi:flavorubredoxin
LAKIALMTLNDMFVFLKRCVEPDLDNIIKLLLKKATDTNIFISEEAEKALVTMCNNCNETKVLQILLALSSNYKANNMR